MGIENAWLSKNLMIPPRTIFLAGYLYLRMEIRRHALSLLKIQVTEYVNCITFYCNRTSIYLPNLSVLCGPIGILKQQLYPTINELIADEALEYKNCHLAFILPTNRWRIPIRKRFKADQHLETPFHMPAELICEPDLNSLLRQIEIERPDLLKGNDSLPADRGLGNDSLPKGNDSLPADRGLGNDSLPKGNDSLPADRGLGNESLPKGNDSLPADRGLGNESLPKGNDSLPADRGLGNESLPKGNDSLPKGNDSLPGLSTGRKVEVEEGRILNLENRIRGILGPSAWEDWSSIWLERIAADPKRISELADKFDVQNKKEPIENPGGWLNYKWNRGKPSKPIATKPERVMKKRPPPEPRKNIHADFSPEERAAFIAGLHQAAG